MSDSASTGAPGGYGPTPPPIVAPPPVVPAARDLSQGPAGPIETLDPWISIWSRPRATLRHILDTDPRRGVFRLAALSGIADFLTVATQPGFGDTYPISVVVPVAVAGGAVGGVIGILIFTALICLTGRWLGGRGGMAEVMAALAWGSVPTVCSLVLWLPRAALLGEETFHPLPASVEGNPPTALLFAVLQGIQVIMAVWGFAISLKCIGEAHGFSAWRALGALALSALVLSLPLVLIAILGQALS